MSPSGPGAFPGLVFPIASWSSVNVMGSSNGLRASVGKVGIWEEAM